VKSCTTLDVIPTLKLWGLQGEASKMLLLINRIMQDMAGGAGFQPSTVGRPKRNLSFQNFEDWLNIITSL